jgi:hypothetical protein
MMRIIWLALSLAAVTFASHSALANERALGLGYANQHWAFGIGAVDWGWGCHSGQCGCRSEACGFHPQRGFFNVASGRVYYRHQRGSFTVGSGQAHYPGVSQYCCVGGSMASGSMGMASGPWIHTSPARGVSYPHSGAYRAF